MEKVLLKTNTTKKSARVCKSVQECARVCESVQECARVCESVQECARVGESKQECVYTDVIVGIFVNFLNSIVGTPHIVGTHCWDCYFFDSRHLET